MFYGQLRPAEITAIRVLDRAYGWRVMRALLEVRASHALRRLLMPHENMFRAAGDLSRLDTLRIRGRLRFLRDAGGARDGLDDSAAHLLEPLFTAIRRADIRVQGRGADGIFVEPLPAFGGDEWDANAKRDLVEVLRALQDSWPEEHTICGALRELDDDSGERPIMSPSPRATERESLN